MPGRSNVNGRPARVLGAPAPSPAQSFTPVAETCRMHGLDLFVYLAGVCTASMANLAVPQLLPASA